MINRVQVSHNDNEAENCQSLRASFLSLFIIILFVLLSCSKITTENGQKSSQKMSSKLSQVLNKLESPEENSQILPARVDEDGRVQIYVRLNVFNQENLDQIEEHGLEIEIYDEQIQIVQGWALPENIRTMSQFDFVKSIDLPKYVYTK